MILKQTHFPNKEEKISHPMVVQIRNNSEDKKEWRLFGFNEFNKKRNFGNKYDVKVTSLTEIPYENYFNNTAKEEFRIGKMRFQSSTKKNIQTTICHHKTDIFRGTYKRKELNLAIMMDAYQQQNDIVDVTKQWKIAQNRHISGIIQPNSTLVVTLFPICKGTKIPHLSGKNMAPVIIQTVQPIKLPTTKKTPIKKTTKKTKV